MTTTYTRGDLDGWSGEDQTAATEWLSSYGIPWPAVTDVVVDDDGTTTVVLLHLDRAARGAQVGGDLAGRHTTLACYPSNPEFDPDATDDCTGTATFTPETPFPAP